MISSFECKKPVFQCAKVLQHWGQAYLVIEVVSTLINE